MRLAAFLAILAVLTPIQAISRQLGKKNKGIKSKNKGKKNKGKKNKGKKNKGKKNKGNKNTGNGNKGKENKDKDKQGKQDNCNTVFFIDKDGDSLSSISDIGFKRSDFKEWEGDWGGEPLSVAATDDTLYALVDDSIVTVDLNEMYQNFSLTRLHNYTVDDMAAISVNSGGELYGISVSGFIYEIATYDGNAIATSVGQTDRTIDNLVDIGFAKADRLYAIDATNVYEIKLNDLTVNDLGEVGTTKNDDKEGKWSDKKNKNKNKNKNKLRHLGKKKNDKRGKNIEGNDEKDNKDNKDGDKDNKDKDGESGGDGDKDKDGDGESGGDGDGESGGDGDGESGGDGGSGEMSGLIVDKNNLFVVLSMDGSPYALLNPRSKGNGKFRIRAKETKLEYPGSGAVFCLKESEVEDEDGLEVEDEVEVEDEFDDY